MLLDWLVFCDYGLCVCPLMPFTTPTILLGFLLPWMWCIFSQLLQQSTAIAPYFGRGVSPHSRPPWPWTLSSSSQPSCSHTAKLLQLPWLLLKPFPFLSQPLSPLPITRLGQRLLSQGVFPQGKNQEIDCWRAQTEPCVLLDNPTANIILNGE